jgi:hypothetical protein
VKECLGGDIMGQSNQCTMGAYSKLSQWIPHRQQMHSNKK